MKGKLRTEVQVPEPAGRAEIGRAPPRPVTGPDFDNICFNWSLCFQGSQTPSSGMRGPVSGSKVAVTAIAAAQRLPLLEPFLEGSLSEYDSLYCAVSGALRAQRAQCLAGYGPAKGRYDFGSCAPGPALRCHPSL